jgi:hypothetical protein
MNIAAERTGRGKATMADQRLLGVMERKESRTEKTVLDRQDETTR